jgi:adenine phosphoribosyltransferase
MEQIAQLIRTVPDFPKKGINFFDITTLIRDGEAFHRVVETFVDKYRESKIDFVVGTESRGFLFAAPVAYKLGCGVVPVRKPGKLPAETIRVEYSLEYGVDTVEMHKDALKAGARVLVIDDLLATGGTIEATCRLVEQGGGEIIGVAFVIELDFLSGRKKLEQYDVFSLIHFDAE